MIEDEIILWMTETQKMTLINSIPAGKKIGQSA